MRVAPLAALLLVIAGCAGTPRRSLPSAARIPDVSGVPDAVPRAEPRSVHGNPPFYEVAGQRYVVLANAAGYVERGVASWYGPDFHGKDTSSGEAYDMYAMTAAHKTLPLPCYARVTNLGNGRSVIVRINDRGPFVANRIVDLSYTAAARLDIIRAGTAFVELQVLAPADAGGMAAPLTAQAAPTAAPVVTGRGIFVQVGAYADEANARRALERLQAAGIAPTLLSRDPTAARAITRVRIGPLASVADYDALLQRLSQLGFRDARVASD
jgi:rare lipoprotein A